MQVEWKTSTFDALRNDELYDILQLRMQVFILEQDSIYLDLDGKDLQASHMLGTVAGGLCAYQRCLPPGASYPESSLGRIVVAPKWRGHSLGRELVSRGIAYNLSTWPDSGICISAQAHLQPFYSELGFCGEGPEYQEDGIPHRKMRYTQPGGVVPGN